MRTVHDLVCAGKPGNNVRSSVVHWVSTWYGRTCGQIYCWRTFRGYGAQMSVPSSTQDTSHPCCIVEHASNQNTLAQLRKLAMALQLRVRRFVLLVMIMLSLQNLTGQVMWLA
jgi:hypothetical protein